MTTNVNNKDILIERLVMSKLVGMYPPFRYITFKHNFKSKTSLFDFYGYFGEVVLDAHIISADVKVRYDDPDRYNTDIMSVDKWQEFIANKDVREHYLIIYYPDHSLVRVYNLGVCSGVFSDSINIFHKRQNQKRVDTVMHIPVFNADYVKDVSAWRKEYEAIWQG